jgi:glycosyltransferase involved in cell wall biosynthesis
MALARERAVLSRFTFSGHCENVPERLTASDIFVLPSRSEAFPNAVLEAMAGGLPVIASAVGGILELVEHERTGLLVPAGNEGLLAAALCTVMADGSLAARLGTAAREEVEHRFSFDRMVAGFERIYLEQLARRGVLPSAAPELVVS